MLIAGRAISGKARQSDVRAQESAGPAAHPRRSSRRFVLRRRTPAAAGDTSAFGARAACFIGLVKCRLNVGGEKEAIADQCIGGIESRSSSILKYSVPFAAPAA
jgi:hypothetical protein